MPSSLKMYLSTKPKSISHISVYFEGFFLGLLSSSCRDRRRLEALMSE